MKGEKRRSGATVVIQESVREALARREAVRTQPKPQAASRLGQQARERTPIIIQGILTSRYTVIPAARLCELRIDESYQRMRVEGLVADLAFVLRHGGKIPQPVTIIHRSNGEDYLVDGQQRFWAHLEANADMPAMVHTVDSFETEKQMFIALNTLARVGPAVMVRSWPGPCAGFLIQAHEDRDHPLYARVNFGVGGFTGSGSKPSGLIGAVGLIHGMSAAASANVNAGHIVKLLQGLDAKMAIAPAARARAEMFLRLAPEVFPAGRADSLRLRSLGLVAFQRWGDDPTIPHPRILGALLRIDWKDLVPSSQTKFVPVVVEAIRKRWPERWR